MAGHEANSGTGLPGAASDLTLGSYAPRARSIEVAGQAIVVKAAGLVQLAQMFQLLKSLLDELGKVTPDTDIDSLLSNWVRDPAEAQALIEAAAIGVHRPVAWLADMGGDEQLQVIVAVLEVNSDFFGRSLLPSLRASVETWMGRLLDGLTSSNSSSTTGTTRMQ